MNELAFMVTVLEASIKHGKKAATRPQERREAALFYVRVLEDDYKRKRLYSRAHSLFNLYRAMQQAPGLMSLLDGLRTELGPPLEPPTSNTGVRSPGEAALEAKEVHNNLRNVNRAMKSIGFYDELINYLEGKQP